MIWNIVSNGGWQFLYFDVIQWRVWWAFYIFNNLIKSYWLEGSKWESDLINIPSWAAGVNTSDVVSPSMRTVRLQESYVSPEQESSSPIFYIILLHRADFLLQ